MKVEILHIDECPNWEEAGRLVRAALDEVAGRDVDIQYRLLSSSAEAADVWFAGSPTILIDGADAFPTDGRTTDLACRVYHTDHGLAGLPTKAQILRVVRERL